VPFFRRFQRIADESGTRHSGIQYGMAVVFKPRFQERNVCRSADAVGAFQNDQFAFQLTDVDARETLTIEPKSTHLRILVFLIPSSVCVTISRIWTCWSSIDWLASITTRPNS